MTDKLAHLSEMDHLKLQVAAAKAERDQAIAMASREAFSHEVTKIGSAYGLTSADSVDVTSGVITRAVPGG